MRDGPASWWLRGVGDPQRPDDVARVLSTSHRSAVVGYDVIVAAPRPISVLVAIEPEHAGAIVAAHRRAVAGSLEYLEERAVVVRDRRGGDDLDLAGRWSHVVGFTHGVNRHGEPHLHDHVLVGARPVGALNVLDSRALFAHAGAADALYRCALRAEVRRTTPFVPWRSFEGVEHVDGLDEGYRVLWGGHHADRGEKRRWSRHDALSAWASDLARFETYGARLAPSRGADVLSEHAFAAAFEGRDQVARRHVVAAWANAATFGRDVASVAASVDHWYPQLRDSRGIRETLLGVREARMIEVTRERGPRPLDVGDLDQWRQRSLTRSRDSPERSR
ncbi:MAG: relaxase domain-containing protein [Acidobacteria bacterium]|nr:relaxase domain-containing protein [Acidobacteriota bacterium]